jgi:uridine kinase
MTPRTRRAVLRGVARRDVVSETHTSPRVVPSRRVDLAPHHGPSRTLHNPPVRPGALRSDNAWSVYLDELVAAILAKPGPLRLVAVDGPGGAGKSTLARELSEAAGGAPVVHTDDFAAADNPIDWWPRLLEQVIEPLARGDAAHYQRYDWPSETLADWHTIEPAPIVIIEGVSAGRSEWAAHLSFLIWIETPREERLRRGVDRDGIAALDDWESWMAGEDGHYERDPTRERADVVIDGTHPVERSRPDRHA